MGARLGSRVFVRFGVQPGQKRILVVDDNFDAADTLAVLLQLLSYDVRTAYNGRQCVDLASAWHPHLVLMDINMPVMDGYEAARALRSGSSTDAPVLIALTACGTDEDKSKAAAAGFDVHLLKPVDGHDLCELVARTLEPS
jgi:CheY-like chemotaxis protein